MTRLFVYGTLLTGEHNHHLMGGLSPVGTATTEPVYSLLDMGGYPAVVEGGQTAIVGELYDVDAETLSRLDILEDVPELYLRVTATVAGDSVELYVLRPEHAGGGTPIPRGDWRDWRAGRQRP